MIALEKGRWNGCQPYIRLQVAPIGQPEWPKGQSNIFGSWAVLLGGRQERLNIDAVKDQEGEQRGDNMNGNCILSRI